MLHYLHARRFRSWLAPAAVVLGIVLVCVPGLTRIGQKLETSSHAPSFAKNIDCPPKKVTVAPVLATASAMPARSFEIVPQPQLAPLHELPLPRSPYLSAPRPLRAPPSARLA